MLTSTYGEAEREGTHRKYQCMKKKDVMKIADTIMLDDELRPEYDETLLKDGIRGKYVGKFSADTHIVLLESDVANACANEDMEK